MVTNGKKTYKVKALKKLYMVIHKLIGELSYLDSKLSRYLIRLKLILIAESGDIQKIQA